MPTPHISAKPGDFADTVLLPGDPLRAAYIAEHHLQNAVCVTKVRNMFGFTGEYRGQRVSVMGSGMGIPSCSIYASELIDHYGVKRVIRVGTCGAVQEDLALGDLILAQGACTDSGVNRQRFGGQDYAAIASWPLLKAVADRAEAQGVALRVGNIYSSDLFYGVDDTLIPRLTRMGILGIEMEAAGLYGLAAERKAEALTVLTVSDHLLRHEAMSAEQRQIGLDRMIDLTLQAVMQRA